MFSPFYAWSRRRGGGDPEHFCCINVALYGATRRWAMTERGRGALARDATYLQIGPSALHWDGSGLTIRVDEVTAPVPSRLRGEIRVHPRALTGRGFALDLGGRHRWSPIAPAARVEVALERPGLSWSGPGYLDSNEGDRALEADFAEWDWCRAPMGDGAAVLYNASRLEGGDQDLALRIDAGGAIEAFEPPPRAYLPRTAWRLKRPTRCDAGASPRLRETLTDAPFYARSVIETRLGGHSVHAMHEVLSLPRFTTPWVQAMLPFRIPRRW